MQSNVNYILEEVIGEGAMATVFKARHRDLDSLHAIKKLKIQDFDVQNRLIQEGRLLANIRHPNILSVTDLVKLDGSPSLVMEYIKGPSLAIFLSRFELAEQQIDALARGILNGVMAAHKEGLIHRDLKPGNILIDVIDDVVVPKVADFGLAKIMNSTNPILPQTRTGVTMGTPAYMAPEQIKNFGSVDERADIFSLGIILYEIVTGTCCFEGSNTMEIWEHICNGKYVLPEVITPSIPKRMKRAIEKALMVERADRFSSVQELLDCWCTDDENNYVPLLSKEERNFWPKDLLERMMEDITPQADSMETRELSEQVDITPLLDMAHDLQHIHSQKDTILAASVDETIEHSFQESSSASPSKNSNGIAVFALLFVGVVASLSFLSNINNETSNNTQMIENVHAPSKNYISNSLLNPFTISSPSYHQFEQARHHLLMGEYYASSSLLDSLIEAHPNSAAVFAMKGAVEFLREHPIETLFFFQRAEHLGKQNKDPNLHVYQFSSNIASPNLKKLDKDPLFRIYKIIKDWDVYAPEQREEITSSQRSHPNSIAFIQLELRNYREAGEWNTYASKSANVGQVYTSSAVLQREYAIGQNGKNTTEVAEKLLRVDTQSTNNIDHRLFLANFFSLHNNESNRMQQFMMALSDTVPPKEQMFFVTAHAKHLAHIGRIFEAEKLWNFCIDNFPSQERVQARMQCSLDAIQSWSVLNPSEVKQQWVESLIQGAQSKSLLPEWRTFYTLSSKEIEAHRAIMGNDTAQVEKIEEEMKQISQTQAPFMDTLELFSKLNEQKMLFTFNQEARHQFITEHYPKEPKECSTLTIAAHISAEINLQEQADAWRESFLSRSCHRVSPNLLPYKAMMHVQLADSLIQRNNPEEAKEHLTDFFAMWHSADKELALFQKAQQLSKQIDK